MQHFAHFRLDELRLVYRILHSQLMTNLELMDADFFQELQDWLQYAAQGQGVDVGDHAQWAAWLDASSVPHEVRVREGQILQMQEGEAPPVLSPSDSAEGIE